MECHTDCLSKFHAWLSECFSDSKQVKFYVVRWIKNSQVEIWVTASVAHCPSRPFLHPVVSRRWVEIQHKSSYNHYVLPLPSGHS